MDSAVGERFRREERLRKRREFLRVYEQGKKIRGSFVFVYLLENDLAVSRLGLTVSRKVGRPVVRNRVKRRLREVFRRHKNLIERPCDVVLNVRRAAAEASYTSLEKEFCRLVASSKNMGKASPPVLRSG